MKNNKKPKDLNIFYCIYRCLLNFKKWRAVLKVDKEFVKAYNLAAIGPFSKNKKLWEESDRLEEESKKLWSEILNVEIK